jgi:uncharacterized membrane protein YhaH (DUF805 family)
MEIWEALKLGLRQYAVFYGRTNRPDYWHFVLALFAISTLLTIVEEAIGLVFNIATLLPLIAATNRRFKDAGVSPKNFWWLALPIVGWVFLVIRLTTPSKK